MVKPPQFRIRTLLVIMCFVGVMVAWWIDRGRLQADVEHLQTRVEELTPDPSVPLDIVHLGRETHVVEKETGEVLLTIQE